MDLDGWEVIQHDPNKESPRFVDSKTEEPKLESETETETESESKPNQLFLDPIQSDQTVEKNPDDETATEIKSPENYFKKDDEFMEQETEYMDSYSTDKDSSETSDEEKENNLIGGETDPNSKNPKWNLNGIGTVCSFGVAAFTVCIIIFGNGRIRKQSHHKIQFQIYADCKNNKIIKKAGKQNGSRLDDAISAIREIGIPFTRAQITFGGHYDAL